MIQLPHAHPNVQTTKEATTTGPDATPPPRAIYQNLGGRGTVYGWSAGRCVGGGGFPKLGGLCATHYYHMHTSRGDVCLGRVWRSCWWLL